MSESRVSPLAFVAVQNELRRSAIGNALRDDGWTVAELPTGFHLVQELADWILEKNPALRPHLIVVDAISPGCTGMTVAAGLAEIGCQIPMVLLTQDNPPLVGGKSADQQQIFLWSRGPTAALTQLARRFRGQAPLLRSARANLV
jgi:CheY-like chemotaxis protein